MVERPTDGRMVVWVRSLEKRCVKRLSHGDLIAIGVGL